MDLEDYEPKQNFGSGNDYGSSNGNGSGNGYGNGYSYGYGYGYGDGSGSDCIDYYINCYGNSGNGFSVDFGY